MRNLIPVALGICAYAALMMVGPESSQASELEERLSNSTHWVNQGGSTMSLDIDCSGSQPGVCTLSGTYVNHVPGFNCKGTPYPLSGVVYLRTQTLSWSVAWSNAHENCASVTGWTGFYDISSNPVKIVTNWNLAYPTSDTGRAIEQGRDIFTETATTQSGSLLRNR